MKRIVTAVLAALLMIIGASVAMAQTDDSDGSTSTTTELDDAGAWPGRVGQRGEVLQGVLDELVTEGTLTQDQADAVVDALDAKRTEFEAQRDELRAAWDEAWSDDILTEDEAAELAADAPFGDRLVDPDGPLAQYWEDGQLTRDELAEAHQGLGLRRGGRHGRWADDGAAFPGTEDSSFSTRGAPAGFGA